MTTDRRRTSVDGTAGSKRVLALLAVFFASGWFGQIDCSVAFAKYSPLQILNRPDSDGEDDHAQETRIGRLITELGSPSYAIRQSAVEQLWELGMAAKPALEKAAAGNDSEVARRATEIISVLSMGIDKNTSPEIAKLVLHFHSSEQNVRTEVVKRLVDDGELGLAFDLLQLVKNVDDQKQLFDEVLDFNDTLIALARGDRWEDFEFILSHPLTLKHRAAASVHYHLSNGTLENVVQRLKIEIKSNETDGKTVEYGDLVPLIAIFRLQNDYPQALSYANKIKLADQRVGILNQLLLEQGNWQAVAKKMVRPEDNIQPADGKIVTTPAQMALVHQFVGNQAGYEKTVSDLSEKASESGKNNDAQGERTIRDTLIEIGLMNLDWPLVESNLDPEDKYQSFRLLVSNNRTEQAFEIVGLGNNVEQRDVWFNRRVRNIESLESKSKRLEDNNQDNDEVNARLNQTWENSFQVARLLGDFGLTDESALHFQTLFAALETDQQKYRRFNVIQELIELERYDVVWNLIENGFDSSHYRQLIAYLFPSRSSSSRFWYDRLKTRYPDPLKRLKVTACVLNSPLGMTPNFDLQVELASAFSNQNTDRNVDYYLGKIYEFHGDEASSQQHMAVARELGLETAQRAHALDAFEQGNFEAAIEFFDQIWQTRQSGFETILAAEAYRQTGESKKAMLRECLAFAMWSNTYRNTGTISSLEEIDQLHLIATILKLDVIRMDGGSVSSERFRDLLATAQFEQEPEQSAINRQLALFQAAAGGGGAQPISFWAESRKQVNSAIAKSKIANGDADGARRLLLQYNEFCPGDPGIGETFIPLLDQAGAKQQADLLFEKLTEPYFEVLEKYPDSSFHHNNYAWICACAKRRTEHMLRHALKASSERPNSSTFKDTLAEIYFLLGDTERAIELSRQCIQINPTKKHYHDQLKRFRAAKRPSS